MWGAAQSSCGGWVAGSRAPSPADHRRGATMVQGGLHRGVAVSEGFRVSLWPSPPQGLSFPPFPSSCTPHVLHRCITAWGIELLDMGATEASAVPGRAYGTWGTVE